MKLCVCLVAFVATVLPPGVGAFCPRRRPSAVASYLRPPLGPIAAPPSTSARSPRLADAAPSAALASSTLNARASGAGGERRLGLLTFDLDDSLYPLAPVIDDANKVFVKVMKDYGFDVGINDIVEAGKAMRREAGPVAGAALSHTEVRLGAIRRELERRMLEKKLKECADDWATEVDSLTGPMRQSAERWARTAVSETVVESIYSAWERERHHSAERHLYPEALVALKELRARHPDVIVGAVTDGKANPMLMVFTLAPLFDFCMSWEDDAAGRTSFFKELGNVDGNADLQWIYQAAQEKYREIADIRRGMSPSPEGQGGAPAGDGTAAPLWIHVGDDLAYDVGGSATCGARTVLLDLDEEYGQTANKRFGSGLERLPAWSTALGGDRRKAMNDAAESQVDKRVSRLSMLPDAVDDILRGE